MRKRNCNFFIRRALVLMFLSVLSARGDEAVVLLHGLGRTGSSMRPIERYLKRHGYPVYNISYPSTRYSIEELCSLYVAPEVERIAKRHDTVSFVTHSMGAIITRYLLTKSTVQCGSIVMLCPPNRGSTLTDSLKKHIGWLYRQANGPAGQQLGHDSMSILPDPGTLRGKIGVIAGDKSWEPYFSWMIPGSDDGKVAVDETRIPGMTDFIVLNHTHTFMMNNRDTQEQIVHFLKHHTFDRGSGY